MFKRATTKAVLKAYGRDGDDGKFTYNRKVKGDIEEYINLLSASVADFLIEFPEVSITDFTKDVKSKLKKAKEEEK